MYGNARPENFPNVNDYRNPIVAEALRVLGYVNKFNRGIARVQEELTENGNDKAEFDVSKLTVFSVVVKDNIATKTTAKTTAIIAAIEATPNIQLKELATLLGVSIEGVRWHLTKLKKAGVIKREGSSRNGKWVVVGK